MNDLEKAAHIALEALERCVATCFDRYAHEQVMSRPEHFVNQAITTIKKALAEQPAQQGCMRCNTPKKCALYGCSPLTWPAEQPAQQKPVEGD